MRIWRKNDSRFGLALLFGGALLLLILFNVLSGLLFGYAVWDATADKRYNLTDTTREFLARNTTNFTIRLYVSRDIKQASSDYGRYADYVNRMLNKYAAAGHGLIKLELLEVTPYSSAEAAAEKVGISPLDIKNRQHKVYLGANIIRSDGVAFSIPKFNLNRKSMLEDDLSRAISLLNGKKSPLIGVLSSKFNVASSGKIMLLEDDWPFIKQLRAAGFRIKPLSSATMFIPEDFDAVLVYYPLSLMPINIFALDQYLVRGGSVMVMLDSFSELSFSPNNKFKLYNSGMSDFLNHLGVSYFEDMIVGDLINNQTVVWNGKRVSYPLYLNVTSSQMANHPIMRNLSQLKLNYSSYFAYDSAKSGLNGTVLYSTGKESGLLPTTWASLQDYNSLQQDLKPENLSFILALLLEGKFKPFYHESLVEDINIINKMPMFTLSPEKEGKLLLVGDSDMAAWSLWRGEPSNDKSAFFSSDNVLFLRNALDYLTSSNYISVGQKIISRNDRNLNEIIGSWIIKKNMPVQEELLNKVNDISQRINKIVESETDNNLNQSAGWQKKVYDLQNEEQSLAMALKKLDYKVQEDYRHYKLYFAFALMIIPAVLVAFMVWVIYGLYRILYLRRQRKKIYEQTN